MYIIWGHINTNTYHCILFLTAVLCLIIGEGFLMGGWILFDKEGIPQSAFLENAKKRVPIDDILKEVKSMGNTEPTTKE